MPLQIYPILCRAGKMDNYSYILADKNNNITIVIDPSETSPIISKLEQLDLKPNFIFNTHHHFDHTDANLPLKEKYNAKVIGNEADKNRIPGFDIGIEAEKTYEIKNNTITSTIGNLAQQNNSFAVIDVSAHTQGHILYYFPQIKALFTGDTLFNLCIGGLFEGTPEQMFTALSKIKALPQDTLFYPGHEYTAHGAHDAYQANNGNIEIQNYLNKAQQNLLKGLPAGPFTLQEEIACNPYLKASTLEDFKKLF